MGGIASALARHWLARALAELGEFSEALVVAQESLDINLSTDNVEASFLNRGILEILLLRLNRNWLWHRPDLLVRHPQQDGVFPGSQGV
jgi:hypothetical protein